LVLNLLIYIINQANVRFFEELPTFRLSIKEHIKFTIIEIKY